MNKDLWTLLNTVKLVDVIVTTLLFVSVLIILITQWKKIKMILENWRKKRNFEDTIIDSIEALKENDKQLQENIDMVWNTMKNARKTSIEIRSEMYDDIKGMTNDLKSVNSKLDEMERKKNLSKQAELKEKIERIYQECHANKVCTDTALDTLKDLIADYERHGGKNSFVHSLVQPEMYTWERIKNIPDPNHSEHE